MSGAPGPFLRWLAALLVRGPGASIVIGDLIESACREGERGMSPGRVRLRFTLNLLASAFSMVRARLAGGRRIPFPAPSFLDVRLAWRMLVRSPGLALTGVLGIALGTALGVGAFVVLSSWFDPHLPLEEGDRIVALLERDARTARDVPRSLHDYLIWREELATVRPLAAATRSVRLLVTEGVPPSPVLAAEMTAEAFEVARIGPLMGRALSSGDERPGAPPVAVIGQELWEEGFDADPAVLGRTVLVDGRAHTVVGVMPESFALPVAEVLWTPLRLDPVATPRGEGPELFVFGRLADGVTKGQALAELEGVGARLAADFPETNEFLRPEIHPYSYPLDSVDSVTLWEAAQLQLMVTLLLVAVAANVAVLVYARTATRQAEIAVRAALGASRRRIVGQLFVEAGLLAGVGAGLGLVIAHEGLAFASGIFDAGGGRGFWSDWSLQPRSALFALGLAALVAVIVGVIPGLRLTGRGLQSDLRRLGGGASVRLGWTWTALIVAQVGVAVAVLPPALSFGYGELSLGALRATFPAEEYLSARVALAPPLAEGMDGDAYRREATRRFAETFPELERRLEADPAVLGVAFESELGRQRAVEVEGGPALDGRSAFIGPIAIGGSVSVRTHAASADYFATLGTRVLSGRALRPTDTEEAGAGVVVSETFVREVLADGPALGRRVRFLPEAEDEEPSAWFEIVGVVEDLRVSLLDRSVAPSVLHHAVAPERLTGGWLMIHVRGDDAEAFAPRLREIAADVDADLHLLVVEERSRMEGSRYLKLAFASIATALGTVLLLSAAGVHALMSLTITRRRREIGVRTALGARPARLLAGIFSRAAGQLALGSGAGALAGSALLALMGIPRAEAAAFVALVLGLMLTAGLAATVGPARRGLRVQPMEALRED